MSRNSPWRRASHLAYRLSLTELRENRAMRNLLALIGLALVVFLGLGNYLGWYKFSSSTGLDGKQHISFDVDTKKIAADSKEGLEKVTDKAGDAVDNLKKNNSDAGHPDFVGPLSPNSGTGNTGLFAPPKVSK